METIKSIKLTAKNQLTVPAKVARQLGIKPGDSMQYELNGGVLALWPRPSVGTRLQTVWTENAKANKGVASNSSIKQTLSNFYESQTSKP